MYIMMVQVYSCLRLCIVHTQLLTPWLCMYIAEYVVMVHKHIWQHCNGAQVCHWYSGSANQPELMTMVHQQI